MGCSGLLPPHQQAILVRGTKDKEHAVAEALKKSITFVGVDVRQELVPRRWSRRVRCNRAAAEVVPQPGGSAVREYAALSDRDGGVRRRASSQPPTPEVRPRCPADACAVRSALFEGTEERRPRRGGYRRNGATADDEVRRDQDRRSARPSGDAPGTRAAGGPAHRHHRPDPRPSVIGENEPLGLKRLPFQPVSSLGNRPAPSGSR
jgi:hypothetical protein